jgi:hypothetical protein
MEAELNATARSKADASRNYREVAKYKRPSDASGDLVKLST